ncbi:unnamed protein product [Anisakis simplex]|uniref:Uncharacterized protein n=1 Tax=Anisakis simplex TaxID=6269 RepID=A0A0M3JA60_ANISI|nr:unnamed protein product [Anisakis simplex]
MCAGLSNRNVQKVSAVVLTVSPSKQQPSSSSPRQSQSDRSYSSSLNHNSSNRPALKSTSDLFNNQQVNVDDRRPMINANLSNAQIRSDVSPSRVVRSFSDADPLRNIPDQSNNAEICALTKWHKMVRYYHNYDQISNGDFGGTRY